MRGSPGAPLLLLAGVIILSLTGCEGDNQGPQEDPPLNSFSDGGFGDGGSRDRDFSRDPAIVPLSQVSVPQPTGGDIVNQTAAVRLGKALFWDVQTGGDGQTACASCHFNAGADNRRTNTVNPGPDKAFRIVSGPGQVFNFASFSADDRVGSQGVVKSIFKQLDPNPANAADICTPNQTAPFFGHRQVTDRNAPSVIGAVFFRDNFWDGRASNIFNGNDPFGQTGNGSGPLSIGNASLASQAVGPPLNDVEMSCAGRPFNGPNGIGTKLLARTPLGKQRVSTSDGVLGPLANGSGNGLTTTYAAMIIAAFRSAVASDARNQFSRIFGQAVQAYEATLIPDQTPFDRFLAGDRSALTSTQQRGFDVFTGDGKCARCHGGGELSDATVSFAAARGLSNRDGGDQGYHNIGVRPTQEDLGRGGRGPNGIRFSRSGSSKDNGAFKTPGLRNIKLTAPYFHNGDKATIEDVLVFYDRGGDFDNREKSSLLERIFLRDSDRSALADLLRNGMTDCRVETQRAPFDHPSLPLPNAVAGNLPVVGQGGIGTCQ